MTTPTTCRLTPCDKPQTDATCFCLDHTPLWLKSQERKDFFVNHTCDNEDAYEAAVQAFVLRNTVPDFPFDWVPVPVGKNDDLLSDESLKAAGIEIDVQTPPSEFFK